MSLTQVPASMLAASAQYIGFKNRIINGGMQIDQMLCGASVTPTAPSYTVDQWVLSVSVASKLTAQRVTDAPLGAKNSLKITVASSYSVSSTDNFIFYQPIEGNNIVDLQFGTSGALTIATSFQVKSSVTGTFAVSLHNGANNRSYVATYSIPVANTWTPLAITIPGDTAGTWATDNSVGMYLFFDLGSGSTFNGTAGSWSGSTKYNTSGSTSFVGQTAGATWQLAQVQLEAGSFATSLDVRNIGAEIALCQRYYEKSFPLETSPGIASVSGCVWFPVYTSPPGYLYGSIPFKVQKRTSPTMSFWSYSGASGQASDGNVSNIGACGPQGQINEWTSGVGNSTGGTVSPAGSCISVHFLANARM